jgi:two-component system chemotaxis response regulator CheB
MNPVDNQTIEAGKIYVAPPGCHMLVKQGCIRVIRGPKENGHRPAIDPLFRSAARAYGKRSGGVILSGMLDDGVMGLCAISEQGGITMVQDPSEAMFPDMPRNAISHLRPDFVAPVAKLAGIISELATGLKTKSNEAIDCQQSDRSDPVEMTLQELSDLETRGHPSAYTCPECNGTLFELTQSGFKHYRCRVGHAYSPESLEQHQAIELEAALWEALKSMEENLALSKRLLAKATESNRRVSARYYSEKIETGQQRIELLRNVLNQTISHGNQAEDQHNVAG